MPKGYVKTERVNKKVFMRVLKLKGVSIRQLDHELSIECSDKTIRRSLNNGQMRNIYIEQIAKFLDVDSRLLTGELVRKAFQTANPELKRIYMSPLTHIDDFPYFRSEQAKLRKESLNETLKRILSLFEISYEQFESKDFDAQYNFQHELLCAIFPVIYKHFETDGYGNSDKNNCYRIINDLEIYHKSIEEQKYANTVLREYFLKFVPRGYTKDIIEKMSADELIQLDVDLQIESNTDN